MFTEGMTGEEEQEFPWVGKGLWVDSGDLVFVGGDEGSSVPI